MLSAKDVAIVYETLLTSPGMGDTIKISLAVPRKNVLLLTRVIEAGLDVKEGGHDGLLAAIDTEVKNELKALTTELLGKAGLTGVYDKLNSLLVK